MALSIEKLRREHRVIQKVLDLAVAELDRLEGAGAGDPVHLKRALDFARHYFDRVHHPHEDLVFDRLQLRVPEAREAIEPLTAGHEALYELGELLDEYLARCTCEIDAFDTDFAAVCRRYLELQREHLAREEETALPLAERCLTEADWQAIAARQHARENLSAGERAAFRYGALYEFLMTAANSN